MENDDTFTFLFNDEYEKLPKILKFTKKRYKITRTIMLVLLPVVFILTTVFSYTCKTELVPSLLQQSTVGTYQLINTYEYGYLIAALICAIVIALLGGWMVIAKAFEKRAYKRASHLSNMVYLEERHKQARIWSEWKSRNGDY